MNDFFDAFGPLMLGAIAGFLIGVFVFAPNVESHTELIRRGLMQHNPTNGLVEWKTNFTTKP